MVGTVSSTLSVSDGTNTYNVANSALTATNGTSEGWLAYVTTSGALPTCTSSSDVNQLGCVAFDISKSSGSLTEISGDRNRIIRDELGYVVDSYYHPSH